MKDLSYTLAAAAWAAAMTLAPGLRIAAALDYPGTPPGQAVAEVKDGRISLSNQALDVAWTTADGKLLLAAVVDRSGKTPVQLAGGEAFSLVLAGGKVHKASDLKLVEPAKVGPLPADPNARRLADRSPGRQVTLALSTPDGSFRVAWKAWLRDQSNCVVQRVAVSAGEKPLDLKELVLVDITAPDARPMGSVDGSPAAAGRLFFACEHPMAKTSVQAGRIRSSIVRNRALAARESLAQSSVVGTTPEGQFRRGFLYYLERERAFPYRPFLHYNSWYDIAWDGRKFNDAESLAVIETFGKEFIGRRGAKLDSIVFDDGWDDNKTLWQFHSGFPNGFRPLRDAAIKHGTAVGIWLSPWGGYGTAKDQRLAHGRQQGFEINPNGFALSGKKYFAWFRRACEGLMDDAGINYFKFDGVGAGNNLGGVGPQFTDDIEAMLAMVDALREKRPSLFVNVTTGTWPSPYWLWHCDSTWRSGDDMGQHGWGPTRQKWITYRDNETYHNIVLRGPLYPLNSLMNQGICHARYGLAGKLGKDLREWTSEVRSFFGIGVNVQELYITPQLLTAEMWDVLAEGAKWSRANSDVLIDAHWIGGDPAKAEVYGVSSWSPRKGILMLRNPSDKPRTFALDIGKALELPAGAAGRYRLSSPWKEDQGKAAVEVEVGHARTLEFAPFQVYVFEALPK
jgi:hypothetical protein